MGQTPWSWVNRCDRTHADGRSKRFLEFYRQHLLIFTQVQEKLGLLYKTTNELNKIVDALPSRPKFTRSEICVGDKVLEVYHRNIIDCILALFGDPEFAPHIVFTPERHYADEDKTIRMYSDMHTGKWWWCTQV